METDLQYATFYLGPEYLAIDVLKVQEVVRFLPITPVPNGPDYYAGLMNLRGQIVPVVDLRRRLGFGPRPVGPEAMNLIVKTESGPISFVVDDIGEVIEAPAHSLERPPNHLNEQAAPYISGVHKLPGSLLAVLDVQSLTGCEGGAK